MKPATIGDVMKMLVMLREWGAKNGPDLNGEGRNEDERADNEVAKVQKVATSWHPLLDDLTQDELFSAAKAHSKGSPWFPAPAEIRAHVPRLQMGALHLETADPTKGRDRWPEIVRQAGSLGRSCQDWPEKLAARIGVRDASRLQRAIEDAGGWRNLCIAPDDFTRSSMGRRFAASWDRQARATATGLLPTPERARLDDRGDGGTVLDIVGELARRKALGAANGQS